MTLSQYRWRWGRSPEDFELLRAHLDERLQTLERALDEIQDAMLYGPLPGAQAFISLGLSTTGTLATGTADVAPTSFEAVPVAIYASVETGGITIQVRNNGTDILAADLSVATQATADAAADFNLDRLDPGDISLEIISVDSGTPLHVRAVVMLTDVSRVGEA